MRKRYRKPRVHLEQCYNGYFMLERTKSWVARDDFGNYVTSARTRKECEDKCRRLGYCPERDVVSLPKPSVLKKLQETTVSSKVSSPSRDKEQEER